jgi:hypothetical protein
MGQYFYFVDVNFFFLLRRANKTSMGLLPATVQSKLLLLLNKSCCPPEIGTKLNPVINITDDHFIHPSG